MLLESITIVLFVGTISHFRGYMDVVHAFGDSQAYISVATAIRHWDFSGLEIKHFWGYPYVMAAVSVVTGLSETSSLLIVSSTSSILSAALAYRLWGGRVAALFAILNFDWMQRSFLGGSEPLATVLIFGAFLALRRDRYLLAAFLASLSTVVRPLGIFCLIAIGFMLLVRREYKRFALAVLIGAIVGGLYALPLARHFDDPLATVHSYAGPGHYSLFGVPFVAILKGTLHGAAPSTNLILDYGWIVLVLAGVVMMFRDPDFRRYARDNPVEVLFAALYLLMVFSYNYPAYAVEDFARFVIPALPIVSTALLKWIPRDRRILYALTAVTPILAGASAIGIRNAFPVLR